MYKIKVIPNSEEIAQLIKDNDGYCPCRISKNEDTKCPCLEFREQDNPGVCHCGRYCKVEI